MQLGEFVMQLGAFQNLLINIGQGSYNVAHEIYFSAEFIFNPNQTHLSMLITECVYMHPRNAIIMRF